MKQLSLKPENPKGPDWSAFSPFVKEIGSVDVKVGSQLVFPTSTDVVLGPCEKAKPKCLFGVPNTGGGPPMAPKMAELELKPDFKVVDCTVVIPGVVNVVCRLSILVDRVKGPTFVFVDVAKEPNGVKETADDTVDADVELSESKPGDFVRGLAPASEICEGTEAPPK